MLLVKMVRILPYMFYAISRVVHLKNCDANWASCINTRRSLTGCYIFFGSALISWKTKKQTTMSHSYVEVEYRSMGSIVCELQWISYLLQDFGFLPSLPIPLWCDNFKNVPNIWRLIVTCFEISSSIDLFHLSTFLPSFKLQTYSQKLYLLLVFLFCCPNWYVNELIIFKSIQQ